MKLLEVLDKEQKSYAIRSVGQGRTQTYRLIDRRNKDMHHMFFDSELAAEMYCHKNGHLVDNSAMD